MPIQVFQLVRSVHVDDGEETDAVLVLDTFVSEEKAQAARRGILRKEQVATLRHLDDQLAAAKAGLVHNPPVSPAVAAFLAQRREFVAQPTGKRGAALAAEAKKLGIGLDHPDYAGEIEKLKAALARLEDFEAYAARANEPHVVARAVK